MSNENENAKNSAQKLGIVRNDSIGHEQSAKTNSFEDWTIFHIQYQKPLRANILTICFTDFSRTLCTTLENDEAWNYNDNFFIKYYNTKNRSSHWTFLFSYIKFIPHSFNKNVKYKITKGYIET